MLRLALEEAGSTIVEIDTLSRENRRLLGKAGTMIVVSNPNDDVKRNTVVRLAEICYDNSLDLFHREDMPDTYFVYAPEEKVQQIFQNNLHCYPVSHEAPVNINNPAPDIDHAVRARIADVTNHAPLKDADVYAWQMGRVLTGLRRDLLTKDPEQRLTPAQAELRTKNAIQGIETYMRDSQSLRNDLETAGDTDGKMKKTLLAALVEMANGIRDQALHPGAAAKKGIG